MDGKLGQASQFEATEDLIRLSERFDLAASDLCAVIPRNRLIRLKDEGKNLIGFRLTPEIESWMDQISDYNEFMADQRIELDLSAEQATEMLAEMHKKAKSNKKKMGVVRPELYSMSVYRVFNNGTFNHGGRLYGPWWQQIPSQFRQNITINTEPTAELDYSGFAIRSLYHQQRIDYLDDPYELEAMCSYAVAQGLDRNHYRESIKDLAQALINGKDGNSKKARISGSVKPFTRHQVFEMLKQKHVPIEWAFASGEGVRNQRLDSDIALDVITALVRAKIPVISIHDSFIVQRKNIKLLNYLMQSFYFNRLKMYPIIKKVTNQK